MSQKNMLGRLMELILTVPGLWGTLVDLLEKLTGEARNLWIPALKKFLRKDNPWPPSTIITILRGRFHPVEFIGRGWRVSANDTDRSSIDLSEIDLAKVQLVTMLKDEEVSISGEEKLRRLKTSGYIRLDADIFITLWENQHLIPDAWKDKVKGDTKFIFFEGTVLKGLDGNRFVLYMYWLDGAWSYGVSWLDDDWDYDDLSAVIAA